LVKPQSGFGAHPHRDAEIFSYVIAGALTHADSLGNREALPRGGLQYMSAGSGVVHSELNEHAAETCRFLQVWLAPDKRGHAPQYGSLRTSAG
jgi:redox-sensitive bicupin YhaK (pirin superfamily)